MSVSACGEGQRGCDRACERERREAGVVGRPALGGGRARVRQERERSGGSESAIRRVINSAGAWLAREAPPPALRRGPGMNRMKRPRGSGPNPRKQENPPLDTHARTHARSASRAQPRCAGPRPGASYPNLVSSYSRKYHKERKGSGRRDTNCPG